MKRTTQRADAVAMRKAVIDDLVADQHNNSVKLVDIEILAPMPENVVRRPCLGNPIKIR